MTTALSILVTLLAGFGLLATLFIALGTSLYTTRVPTGPDAMALAFPALLGIAAAVATLCAGWVCVGRGGFDWVSTRPLVPLAAVTAVLVGVGLCGAWGFVNWAEHGKPGPAASLLAALVVPAAAQGLILLCAWRTPEAMGGAWVFRSVALALFPGAFVGVAFGGWLLSEHLRATSARMAREAEEYRVQSAEWDRRGRLTHLEKVEEDLAALPPATPFWNVSMMLVGEEEERARAAIIARARLVPGFDDDLKGTAECDFARIRGGAVEFILRDAARDPSWAAHIRAAARLLAEELERRGSMMAGEDDLSLEVERIAMAARVFPGEEFAAEFAALRRGVQRAPEAEPRARALRALGGGPEEGAGP